MVILGFLLIAAAAAAATILIVQNTADVQIHTLGHTWTVSAAWLVVAGLVLLAVAVIGVAAVRRSGTRRGRRERVALVGRNRDMVEEPGMAAREEEAPASRPRRSFHRHRPAV